MQVAALGLPAHKAGPGRRLAVVGGGPSIADHVDELRAWGGEIWAVNGTVNWCLDNGIDAAFYTIDASPPENWTCRLDRIRRAVLSVECSPPLIHALGAAHISLLPKDEAGPTSAAGATLHGLNCGYREIHFFGCESSFQGNTHAYDTHPVADWIDVDIGGGRFRTKPEFAEQAQVLSEVIRLAPTVFFDRSGGLLSAMVAHGTDHDVYQVSNSLYALMQDCARAQAQAE
jgi:hypothetical protein